MAKCFIIQQAKPNQKQKQKQIAVIKLGKVRWFTNTKASFEWAL